VPAAARADGVWLHPARAAHIAKQTAVIYWGMALNLLVNALGLVVGVMLARASDTQSVQASLLVGVAAFQLAALAEIVYLRRGRAPTAS
jgi:hypothetical protein